MAECVLSGWIVPFQTLPLKSALLVFHGRKKQKQTTLPFCSIYGLNPSQCFGLNGHQEFQIRGCLCCQSKAEQWLRLIFFILMNANWHICYGGLAVQTLQLAWLINYPPAGGSVEMEAAAEMGVEAVVGGWNKRWKSGEEKKKWQEMVQKLYSVNGILYLIRL